MEWLCIDNKYLRSGFLERDQSHRILLLLQQKKSCLLIMNIMFDKCGANAPFVTTNGQETFSPPSFFLLYSDRERKKSTHEEMSRPQ
jgi:hypothetical protein